MYDESPVLQMFMETHSDWYPLGNVFQDFEERHRMYHLDAPSHVRPMDDYEKNAKKDRRGIWRTLNKAPS